MVGTVSLREWEGESAWLERGKMREERGGKEGDLRHQTLLWLLRPREDEREGGGGEDVFWGKYSPFSTSTGNSSTGDGSISCIEIMSSRDSLASRSLPIMYLDTGLSA